MDCQTKAIPELGDIMTEQTALVIDDEEFICTLLTEILAEKQVHVTSFPDPISYFSAKKNNLLLQDDCFDFIITDNMMPGMTGLEFLERIKEMGCVVPDQHKAVISGNWTNEDLEKARELGCRVFYKPCPIREIHSWIEEVRERA